MGKLIVTEFISLDGVMEEPAWTWSYWNNQIAAFKLAELRAAAVQLLGRVTWEGFAEAWPKQSDAEGFADKMNRMPKYVVSNHLDKADWTNSHIISGDVVDGIQKLKQSTNGDILVGGSCTLVQFLIQNRLVDEYHFLVYPVVLSRGKRIFQEGTKASLKLVDAKPFADVTALVYRPE